MPTPVLQEGKLQRLNQELKSIETKKVELNKREEIIKRQREKLLNNQIMIT